MNLQKVLAARTSRGREALRQEEISRFKDVTAEVDWTSMSLADEDIPDG